ncbi:hypothetical protein FRB90_012128 [Tulasnella sp. 427]|nr:hypothetical protein FRB90_012128 [Tulasnella sp. 427]
MSDIRSAQTGGESKGSARLPTGKNFKGKSGSECESFIRSIRRIAWEEGKVQDKTWMAYFASIHFAGRALKWHSDLPPDAQQDWGKMEKALLERWPPPESSDDDEPEAQTIPTPAAAAMHPVPKDRNSELGVLQLIFPDEAFSKSLYLGAALGSHGTCTTTTDINRALKLRWDRSPDLDARVLEWVMGSSHRSGPRDIEKRGISTYERKPRAIEGRSMEGRL